MFLTIKLYLHLNCGLMLNWIVWNWIVFDIETVLTLNWIVIVTAWINWIVWNRNVFDKLSTHAKLNYLK